MPKPDLDLKKNYFGSRILFGMGLSVKTDRNISGGVEFA
jgi:hypothetical protein